jgi:hypothetical protein
VDQDVELATVELLGALAYGQLRAFEASARCIRVAPDVRTADRIAAVAVREHDSYLRLRDHLATRTELAMAVMERQRPYFDAYFDRAPLDDWFGACVFFALGLPIAADFCQAIAPTLDPDSATVVRTALDKHDLEREAVAQLASLLVDEGACERARGLTADLLGLALTSYQGVVADTDALRVLLAADTGVGQTGEQRVKRLAIDVMSGHRRRAVELGLEELDDGR